MIHKVICENFITKKGNFHLVTEEAFVLTYCFMRNIQVDLAGLVFERMKVWSSFPALPYGVYASQLIEYFQISTDGEITSKEPYPFDHRSLRLMKILPAANVDAEESIDESDEDASMDEAEEAQTESSTSRRLSRIEASLARIETTQDLILQELRLRRPDDDDSSDAASDDYTPGE